MKFLEQWKEMDEHDAPRLWLVNISSELRAVVEAAQEYAIGGKLQLALDALKAKVGEL